MKISDYISKEWININKCLLSKEEEYNLSFKENIYKDIGYYDEVFVNFKDGFKIINLNEDYTFDVIVGGLFRILLCLDYELTKKIEYTYFTVRVENLGKNYILPEIINKYSNIQINNDGIFDMEIIKINDIKIIDFINKNKNKGE